MRFGAALRFGAKGFPAKASEWWLAALGGLVAWGLLWLSREEVMFASLLPANAFLANTVVLAICVLLGVTVVFSVRLSYAPIHWRLQPYGGMGGFLRMRLGAMMWPVIMMALAVLAFVILFGIGAVGFAYQLSKLNIPATTQETSNKSGASIMAAPLLGTPHTVPQLTKSYFPSEKVEFGSLLAEISTHLKKEGVGAASASWLNVVQTDRNAIQLQELVDDVERTRKLTGDLATAIWSHINATSKYNDDLAAIFGQSGGNSPIAEYQGALNQFYNSIVFLKERYAKAQPEDQRWMNEQVFGLQQQYVVRSTADRFRIWISECEGQINLMRVTLQK